MHQIAQWSELTHGVYLPMQRMGPHTQLTPMMVVQKGPHINPCSKLANAVNFLVSELVTT